MNSRRSFISSIAYVGLTMLASQASIFAEALKPEPRPEKIYMKLISDKGNTLSEVCFLRKYFDQQRADVVERAFERLFTERGMPSNQRGIVHAYANGKFVAMFGNVETRSTAVFLLRFEGLDRIEVRLSERK